MSKNKHLTLGDRYTIYHGLEKRLSFKTIASQLEKDCTTISKEIKNHLCFEKKGAPHHVFNDCKRRAYCTYRSSDLCEVCSHVTKKCSNCSRCTYNCSEYQKEICPHLLKAPYVCNGCSQTAICTLEKRYYRPQSAQKEYESIRSESRSGINLTEMELEQMDSVISPLLKNGQSIHHIIANNPDMISCCDKTIYKYLNMGLFSARNIDAPRIVRFKPRKAKSVEMKVDKSCRIGRTYDDFKSYIEENPSLQVVEIDSVEGAKGGAVLLTIYFRGQELQLAFLRDSNNSQSVTDIFHSLYKKLGKELYCQLFPVILADNGTEFSNPMALEFNDEGEQISHVFYCDASSPGQKGACEVNHEFIRRVIPKGVDLANYTQDDILRMMNHINSYGRPELRDKTPCDLMEFYYGKNILQALDVQRIPANKIILKPSLLAKRKTS